MLLSVSINSVRVTAHLQKVGSNMSCALFCDDSEEESRVDRYALVSEMQK